jgi:hypothetical protein
MRSTGERAMTLSTHLLRFQSLYHAGRALSFPCDESGLVEIDRLSERGRNNYFFARTSIGRDFYTPVIVPDDDACGPGTPPGTAQA